MVTHWSRRARSTATEVHRCRARRRGHRRRALRGASPSPPRIRSAPRPSPTPKRSGRSTGAYARRGRRGRLITARLVPVRARRRCRFGGHRQAAALPPTMRPSPAARALARRPDEDLRRRGATGLVNAMRRTDAGDRSTFTSSRRQCAQSPARPLAPARIWSSELPYLLPPEGGHLPRRRRRPRQSLAAVSGAAITDARPVLAHRRRRPSRPSV